MTDEALDVCMYVDIFLFEFVRLTDETLNVYMPFDIWLLLDR